MSVTHIGSLSQLSSFLANDNKLSVIDFHAQWCGPCKMIAPIFEALAKQYPGVNFLKCDVDAAPAVSKKYGVTAMPTFILLKGAHQVDSVRGADRNALASAVSRHATDAAQNAFTGRGQTLGSSSARSTSTSVPGIASLPGVAVLDRQTTIFLALLAAYCTFWFMSS